MRTEIAKNKNSVSNVRGSFFQRRLCELGGLFLWGIGGFLFLSLFSYEVSDPSANVLASSLHFGNIGGEPGAYLADLLRQFFGKSAYLFPTLLSLWGSLFLLHRPVDKLLKRFITLVGVATFLEFFLKSLTLYGEGEIGQGALGALFVSKISMIFVGLPKGIVLLGIVGTSFFLMLCCFIYAASLTFSDWKILARFVGRFFIKGTQGVKWVKDKMPQLGPVPSSLRRDKDPELTDREEQTTYSRPRKGYDLEIDFPPFEEGKFPQEVFEEMPPSLKKGALLPLETPAPLPLKREALSLHSTGSYELPPLGLLRSPDKAQSSSLLDETTLEENIERLTQVLSDFGISGKIKGVKPGPVVTLYELEPAPGIKASRVIGLADDIARSMSAFSARIAIVPGKNVIGIELPNEKRQTVFLKELLTHSEFEKESSKLTISLGKNIGGTPVFADLARMPHMIVAGTTGSGKSVAVNAMILSLLYRHSPETCRLLLIDPKMLEFSMYNDIPHLLAPVVTEPKKAIYALKWAVREMEDRYRAMSHLGVRNIESYNNLLKQALADGRQITRRVQTGFDPETGRPIYEEQVVPMKSLPYIVVVVDEMADLMMVAGKDIEAAVQRLAQMARAAGIHVIMATQRPSVDVITGTIKANFPTRISFQVTSKFDSRTILGEQGAEQLLGQGDMLFMEAGGKIQRIHGPFVSDEEVDRVVNFLKTQGTPDYIETITDESSDLTMGLLGDGVGSDDGDELYRQAVAIVQSERKASTSLIQRRLQIGYNRAARIIEKMEVDGVISTANHVGKREVLVDKTA